MAHDDVTHEAMTRNYVHENHLFGISIRINLSNFNATTMKVSEKFDNPFSHCSYSATYLHKGHGFEAVAVNSSKFLVGEI